MINYIELKKKKKNKQLDISCDDVQINGYYSNHTNTQLN